MMEMLPPQSPTIHVQETFEQLTTLLFHLHPQQERAHQTHHHHILLNLDPITMSNKLPGTTSLNSRGEEESVSIFPMPGTEAEEVPLWQFFEERPVPNPTGTTFLLGEWDSLHVLPCVVDRGSTK